jgi:hypothetical protein
MRNGEYDGYGQYMYGAPNQLPQDGQPLEETDQESLEQLQNNRFFRRNGYNAPSPSAAPYQQMEQPQSFNQPPTTQTRVGRTSARKQAAASAQTSGVQANCPPSNSPTINSSQVNCTPTNNASVGGSQTNCLPSYNTSVNGSQANASQSCSQGVVDQFQCITPAFFNAVYNGGAQDVPAGGEVSFLLSFQSGDFEFIPNTGDITVTIPGIYRVDYTLTIRPTIGMVNAVYAVLLNGVPHPFSYFGNYSDGLGDRELVTVRGSFITDILAGEVLSLTNQSDTCNHLTSCTPSSQSINRASILLVRVA